MLLQFCTGFVDLVRERSLSHRLMGATWCMFTLFIANAFQNGLAALMLPSTLGLVLLSDCKA